ncbi:MAG: hypothetical protein FJX92_01430 [Bacteroidetes bacterium]|nr:hypothetical protein [Bacteroidota bacterium]
MKSIVLSVLFSAVTFFQAGAQADTVKLERIQLIFPGKITMEEQGPTKRCQLRLADSTANFQVIQTDLSAMGLDETTAIAMQAEPEFWEQTRNGLVAQMGDSKLIKDEMLDYKGVKMMQMEMERPSKEGGVNRLTLRTLIVGTYMIQYGHTNRNDKADVAVRDAFLSSL